jgi:hypothetical protein
MRPGNRGEACVSDLLDQMRWNPKGNWTIKDVERLCREHRFMCLPPKGGSHYKITKPGYPLILTIPYKRPIKPVYIRLLVRLIDGGK